MDGLILQIVEDEWGTMMALPTAFGQILFTLVIADALLMAMLFLHISKQGVSVSKLALCVSMILLASILAHIQIISLSTGGTVTLFSMLAIMLPAYWFGPGVGIMVCFAYGVFQLLIDPYMISVPQVFVDYIFAFGFMGVCGFFCNSRFGLIKGYIAGIFGRYFFSVISGWIFFGEYAWEGWAPLSYSLAYNASYIFTEAAITVAILLIPAVRRGMELLKATVNSPDPLLLRQKGGES